MSRPTPLFTGLLVAALLGAAAAAYYWAQARQAATLGRITALENRLISSNEQRAQAANSIVLGLSEAVRRNNNQFSGLVVLKQAQKIQARTNTLIDTLQQLRQSWQLAGHNTGLRQLPNQLEQYVLFIKDFVPDASLLNPAFPRTESIGWISKFDTTYEPKAAALALLTKLETQVRQIEAEALEKQAQKVVFEGVFEKMGAFAAAASNTVAPGDIYQAQLALVMATSNSSRLFSANGRVVPIYPATGQGLVQFSVPATRLSQPDTVRAAWHGRIQLPWAASDTVLETTVPYLIVKPRSR